MDWNLENLQFLYRPDVFVGTFTNQIMQARHEAMVKTKLDALLGQLALEKSPNRAMKILHKNDQLTFLFNNLDRFKAVAELEKTVLFLYFRENTPFSSGGKYDTWKNLFSLCDPLQLKQLGDPIPAGRITGYRGSVTGKIKGLSWCIDREKVAWFLDRWSDKTQGGGEIGSMEFEAEDVLLLLDNKNHKEIIVDADKMENAPLTEITSLS